MTYYCPLAKKGCPGGINSNADPDNWPFPKCKGTGRGWGNTGYYSRTTMCPAYAYYIGESDKIYPNWMEGVRKSSSDETEEE